LERSVVIKRLSRQAPAGWTTYGTGRVAFSSSLRVAAGEPERLLLRSGGAWAQDASEGDVDGLKLIRISYVN